MNIETKKGLIYLTTGLGLAWLIVWLIKKDQKEKQVAQPIITEETIKIASDAYRSAVEEKESQDNLDDLNKELKNEYGLTVEYKPLKNIYYVYDINGKKVKEVS